jgi:hypothetical protein
MEIKRLTKYLSAAGDVLLDVEPGGKWSSYRSGNGPDELDELQHACSDAAAFLRGQPSIVRAHAAAALEGRP